MTPFPPSLAIAVAVSIGAHAAAAFYLTPRVGILQATAAPTPLASLPDGFGRPPVLPAPTESPPAVSYLASSPPSPDIQTAPHSQPPTPAASASLPAHTVGTGRPAQARTQASPHIPSRGVQASPLSLPTAVQKSALETPQAILLPSRRTAAQGSARGDAMGDDAMASYLQGVHGALQSALRYPAAARSRQQQGQATLDITLSREGLLLEHRLHASSGSANLDDASLRAARRAQFAPAPPDLEGESFRFRVPLRFHLDSSERY